MDNFRSRPKGNFIENANWEELYILTEHWKSDLLFYKDDLKFLRHLEDKYFLWIKAENDLEGIRKVGESILKDTRDCDDLLQEVDKHLSLLTEVMEGSINYDQRIVKGKHAEMEDDIAQFVKNSRENRKQLFQITEYAIGTNKSEHSKN